MKNKALSLLLSLVIAIGLWVYVITAVNPEYEQTYHNVPVVLQNESILAERGLMVVGQTQGVTLRLKGNRSTLANLNSSNISVAANVSGVVTAGTHQLTYTPDYPGNIPNNAITVQSHNPDTVTLIVEKRITKQVPVKLVFEGAVPEGFIADKENALLDYVTIDVSGPESAINEITQAVINVDLDNREDTFVEEVAYTLCNDAGEPVDAQQVITNADKVKLTVKIQRVKELELTVKVVEGGGATSDDCTVMIQPKTIQVTGSEALLENLSKLELGTVNLAEITTSTTLTFPIVLPEGVHNETGITEATVEVDFGNLSSKTLSITDLKAINLPQGMEVEFITQALEVTVRGPKELVEQIQASDLTATVDFTGAEQGTATIKAKISTSEKFAQVGAVGTYSVSATLRKAK